MNSLQNLFQKFLRSKIKKEVNMKTYYPPKGLIKYYLKKFSKFIFIIIILLLIFGVYYFFNDIKDYISSITEKEVKCIENWECNDWTSCQNSLQSRDCNDINNCGTVRFKPDIQRSCLEQNQVQFTNNENFCGLSMILSQNISVNQVNFESDGSLVCMGRRFLNDCSKSSTILFTYDAGELNFISNGLDENGNCIVRVEYGDESQIISTQQKPFANSFVECKIDIDEIINSNLGDSDLRQYPGTLAFSIYYTVGLFSISESKNLICNGTYIDIINKQIGENA